MYARQTLPHSQDSEPEEDEEEEGEEEEEGGPWPHPGARIIYTFHPAPEQENRKFRLQAAVVWICVLFNILYGHTNACVFDADVCS